jgi:hypothetical protein
MSATLSSTHREQELRLKMDQRTLVEQECEIRYLRRRLEKLTGGGGSNQQGSSRNDGTKALAA